MLNKDNVSKDELKFMSIGMTVAGVIGCIGWGCIQLIAWGCMYGHWVCH